MIMWFVVRKRSNTPPPPPCSVIRHKVTYSSSQYALSSQKYSQAVSFPIPSQMRRKSLWAFRFLSSTALTLGVIQIRRLIFVWNAPTIDLENELKSA